jgi:hypothetical protein
MMIKIYTFAHKRPDFLALQLQSFKKHLKCEFQFIVFNNALFDHDPIHYRAIHAWCKDNDIVCTDIQRDQTLVDYIHMFDGEHAFNAENLYTNAVIACAYPLCWAWKHYLSKTEDKICIIDSDMFLIQDVNMEEMLDSYDLIYMEQSRGPAGEIQYMWNGLVFMNLMNMPDKSSLNWWCGKCEGHPVDVGGRTHYYLKDHRDEVKIKTLVQHYVGDDPQCDFRPANYEYYGLDGAKTVLHYRGGSDWNNAGKIYHEKKTRWLKSKLDGS